MHIASQFSGVISAQSCSTPNGAGESGVRRVFGLPLLTIKHFRIFTVLSCVTTLLDKLLLETHTRVTKYDYCFQRILHFFTGCLRRPLNSCTADRTLNIVFSDRDDRLQRQACARRFYDNRAKPFGDTLLTAAGSFGANPYSITAEC